MAVCFNFMKPNVQMTNLFRSNESEKLAVRYRKFNLQALVDIAVNIKGNSGRSCKYT